MLHGLLRVRGFTQDDGHIFQGAGQGGEGGARCGTAPASRLRARGPVIARPHVGPDGDFEARVMGFEDRVIREPGRVYVFGRPGLDWPIIDPPGYAKDFSRWVLSIADRTHLCDIQIGRGFIVDPDD